MGKAGNALTARLKALGLPGSDWRLALAGGVLFAGAFPPFHLLVPSFVCLIPAVLLIHRGNEATRPVKRQLLQGFYFGFLAHGLVLYWIVLALWHFTSLALLGYVATIFIFALYTGVLFALCGWIERRAHVSLLFSFPVLWTAVEWMISHQGDIRFPWLGLGTSLTHYRVLIQGADIFGARGLTFLLALANVTLAHALLQRRDKRRARLLLGALAAGIVLNGAYGVVRMRTLDMHPAGTLALIQPNVSFDEKWEAGKKDAIVQELLDRTARAVSGNRPDLVVWPEAAVPGYFVARPDWAIRIGRVSRSTGVPIVVGGLDAVRNPPPDSIYATFNAAFFFDSTGLSSFPVYHKKYLVPVTERVPFINPRLFRRFKFFGGFERGKETPVYRTEAGSFGVMICYESAFEELARTYRARGADFLLNITNDAWFGRTSAPYQHAAHLVMRAIETRTGIARAANTGITEFVDPLGRAYHQTGLYVPATVVDTLVTSDTVPPYVKLGDWVGVLSLMLTAALLVHTRWFRR